MMDWIISGGLVAIVGFMLANNRAQDKKIDRNFERLDETKDYQDKTFSKKEICAILHKQISDDLNEIKSDIKIILKHGAGVQGVQGLQGRDGRNGKDGKDYTGKE